MEEIQNQVERLIEDMERDDNIKSEDLLMALYKLKTDIEDYNFRREEYTGGSINWEDLD
jgi:chorismate mutase